MPVPLDSLVRLQRELDRELERKWRIELRIEAIQRNIAYVKALEDQHQRQAS